MSELTAILKLFVFIFCFKQFQCLKDPTQICPPVDMIRPCWCEKPWFRNEVQLTCEKILNQGVLLEVLNKSSDYAYSRFELRSSSIMYLPISAFHTKRLTIISIFSSSMESLFNANPPESNVLEKIELENVRINRRLTWAQFRTLRKLKEFRVRDVSLKHLGKDFRDNLPDSIETMAFFNNSLAKLDDSAFARLKQLKDITLQSGNLKVLKRTMFPVPAKLTDLDFSINKIQSLPDDIFTNMPALKSVLLIDNLITMIPKDVYGQVLPQLNYLYLYGNPLSCKCYLRWILTANRGKVFLSGKCVEPLELEKRDIKTLQAQDFPHCGNELNFGVLQIFN